MTRPNTDFDDAQSARALIHPLRRSILWELELGAGSPADIARRLGATVESVSYHVRKLRDVGLIEAAGIEEAAGTVRHLYRLAVRPRISDKAWMHLTTAERRSMTRPLLQRIARAAFAAVDEGGMDRPDSVVGRAGLTLDEPGFRETHDLLTETHDRLTDIERRAAVRLARPGARRCDGTVITMLFETPSTEAQPQRVQDLPEFDLSSPGLDDLDARA